MKCPHCGHEQASGSECEKCGLIFAKWKPPEAKEPNPVDDLPPPLESIFGDLNVVRLLESALPALSMIFDWRVAREYTVVDSVGRQRGSVMQESGAVFLRSRFALTAYPSQQPAMMFRRTGIFSPTVIDDPRGHRIGTVQRKFTLIRRRYDLADAAGRVFAIAMGSIMDRNKFALVDGTGQQRGEISKQYAGYMQEVSEAHRFKIDFMKTAWTPAQKAVILTAAICINRDVFENRQNKIGIVALGD